jgi:ABC-2 type transport system ATP-binding protein
LTFQVAPPADMPARELQARLIDAPDAIIDAVPSGGAVNYIRRPGSGDDRLAALLPAGAGEARPAMLEDAFMMMLRETAMDAAAPPAPISQEPIADPAADEKPVVVVRDLVRKFGDFTAVASTSFDVMRGEIFGLLGPNGAGKTTTFRMLCGLLPATGGHLEVAGMNLRTARNQARERIGYVAQKFALYGNLTVHENLEFFGGAYGLHGQALRERIDAALADYGLDPDARSGELPGGFKQRLAMATGLLHRPEILFLDEPTSGIDPLARRAFWRTITELAAQGTTIIVTTHFMEEAEYCDRIAIQDAGKVLALGTPQEVRAKAGEGDAETMNAAFIAIVEQARANGTQASAVAA